MAGVLTRSGFEQTGPNQWEPMAATLREAATVPMPASGRFTLEVVRDLDLSPLAGTLVFVGVGSSWDEVRDLNKAGHTYTVQ